MSEVAEQRRHDRIDNLRRVARLTAAPVVSEKAVTHNVIIRKGAVVEPGAVLGLRMKGQPPQQTDIAGGAWIGPNAVVMAGCHIGENAIVMPGAVVFEPVPARHVVQGNPACLVDLACDCGGLLSISDYAVQVSLLSGGWRWQPVCDGIQVPCPQCGQEWDIEELVSDEV
jgi:hypothetical protein